MVIDFNKETSADEFLINIRRLKICDEAQMYCDQYTGRKLGELVDENPEKSWSAGWLTVLGKRSNIQIRETMISHIKDPMMAFMLYLKLAWLTDEEDELLEAKFKGKLPTAENELTQGIVKREKWL